MTGRVQAPDIRAPDPLRAPQAVQMPSQGVQAPVQGDRLGELAKSLGAFNTGLSSFGANYAAYVGSQKDNDKEQEKTDREKVDKYYSTRTPEEYVKGYGTDLGKLTPKAQERADTYHGQYAANDLYKEYLAETASGKLRPEQASEWLHKRRGEILEANGWTPDSAHAVGFGDGFNKMLERANIQAVKNVGDILVQNVRDGAYKDIQMTLDANVGRDPAEAWKVLNSRKAQAFKDGMDPKDYDQLVWSVLGNRMEQDPNWVLQMVTAPRTKGDIKGGGDLPALGDTPERQATIANWRRQALKWNADKAQSEDLGKVAMADSEAFMSGDGSFGQIVDRDYRNPVTGEATAVTAESRRKEAIKAFEMRSEEFARRNGETQTQRFTREADLFILNGVERPQWKSQIETAPQAATGSNLQNPAALKRVSEAGKLYEQLQARSPAYVRDHFGAKARGFFDTAMALKQLAVNPDGSGLTEAQIYSAAERAMNIEAHDADGSIRRDINKAVENKLSEITRPGNSFIAWLPSGIGGSPDAKQPRNAGYLLGETRRLATLFAQSGAIDGATAVEAAIKHIEKSGALVNGMWMPKDQTTGFEAGKVSRRIVEKYVKENAGAGYTTDDLSVASRGNGVFEIVNSTGLPVAGNARFTRSDMLRFQSDMMKEQEQEVLRKQRENAIQRQKDDAEWQAGRERLKGRVNAVKGAVKSVYDTIDPPAPEDKRDRRRNRR